MELCNARTKHDMTSFQYVQVARADIVCSIFQCNSHNYVYHTYFRALNQRPYQCTCSQRGKNTVCIKAVFSAEFQLTSTCHFQSNTKLLQTLPHHNRLPHQICFFKSKLPYKTATAQKLSVVLASREDTLYMCILYSNMPCLHEACTRVVVTKPTLPKHA